MFDLEPRSHDGRPLITLGRPPCAPIPSIFLPLPLQANEGDALAAILLFEENVTLQSGFSLFGVLPLPHLIDPLPSDRLDPLLHHPDLGPHRPDPHPLDPHPLDPHFDPHPHHIDPHHPHPFALDSTPDFDADYWLGAGNDAAMARLYDRLDAVLDGLPDLAGVEA